MRHILAIAALLAAADAYRLTQKNSGCHACDYIDDKGEEIDTSLAVQLDQNIRMKDDDDSVEGAREKFA